MNLPLRSALYLLSLAASAASLAAGDLILGVNGQTRHQVLLGDVVLCPAVAARNAPEHAGNYMDHEPKLPTTMIQPEKVASAILDAARQPTRNVKVGAMARVNAAFSKLLPSLGHRMARMQMGRQQRDEASHDRDGTLFRAGESGRIHGRGDQHAADAREAREANVRPQ